jgi:hypothetical protein
MKRAPSLGLCVLALFAAAPLPAAAVSLADAWANNAAPGGGYDAVLHLDSLAVYTGGLDLTTGRNAIHGHGALIDLGLSAVRALLLHTSLDIDGCVFLNGPPYGSTGALVYIQGAAGHVRNCVFYGNTWGIYMKEVVVAATSVTNCIFMDNTIWGVVLHDVYTPPLTYCAAFRNGVGQPPGLGGNYALWCGCSNPGPAPYTPPPAAHCLTADPMFIAPGTDPAAADFHLAAGSPCLSSGDPPGTNIGAYQEGASPVAPATWGQLKGLFHAAGAFK